MMALAYNNKVSFQNSLQRLVDAFPDRRFILVEDIPVGAELSISNAARAMHIQNVFGENPKLGDLRFGIERQRYEDELASYRPIFAAVARSPNVSIVSLIDALPGFAAAGRGWLLFFDGDHLSTEGATMLTDTFVNVFGQRQALHGDRN
ncbi:MAG TPA: SGNH hydrolase domain-containing protein [Methyloceanibacter sp.]|nr:SGNH hydrolase domain-containing protein [Methyloceanibacter sp.]